MRPVGDATNINHKVDYGNLARLLRSCRSRRARLRIGIALVIALPLAAGMYAAAQDKPIKIGVLALGPRYVPTWHCGQADYRPGSGSSEQDTKPYYVLGLIDQLKKLKYVEERPENAGIPGPHFLLTMRTGTLPELRTFAHEFVADHVDIIVGVATAGVQVAQEETQGQKIPILMTGVSDPVKYGFVQSLARPGGNITGVSHQVVQGSGKRLELFKEILPGLKRLLTIREAGYPPSEKSMQEIRDVAARLNIEIIDRTTSTRSDIQDLMAGVRPDAMDGMMILPDSHVIANVDLLLETSLARRVPAFGLFDYMAAWGAIAENGPSAYESGADDAWYIDKISKGAKPGDLPVQPVDPTFVVNLKAAQCLGVTVPQEVLSQADKVIR